jgi:hypothetical protein
MNLAEQLFEKGFDVERVKYVVTMIAGSPDTPLEGVFTAMIPLENRIRFLEECWETIESYDG